MSDVEKGKPSVAIATYIGALWALGLTDELIHIADPDNDSQGKAFENARAPKTAAPCVKCYPIHALIYEGFFSPL